MREERGFMVVEIVIGPDSPDPRLRPITFCPRQGR